MGSREVSAAVGAPLVGEGVGVPACRGGGGIGIGACEKASCETILGGLAGVGEG